MSEEQPRLLVESDGALSALFEELIQMRADISALKMALAFLLSDRKKVGVDDARKMLDEAADKFAQTYRDELKERLARAKAPPR